MSRYTTPEQKKPLELSDEETQIMKKCLEASFWTHSIPCTLISMAGMKLLSLKGFKPGIFTITVGITGSAIMGRILAIPSCLDEICKKVPDGQFAAMINKNRMGDKRGYSVDDLVLPEHDDVGSKSTILDDATEKSAAQSKQTYDELRRRNREQYLYNQNKKLASSIPESSDAGSKLQGQFPSGSYDSDPVSSYSDPPSPYSDYSPSVPVVSNEEPKPRRRVRVNKYGDEIIED